jgi:hypothetical protein
MQGKVARCICERTEYRVVIDVSKIYKLTSSVRFVSEGQISEVSEVVMERKERLCILDDISLHRQLLGTSFTLDSGTAC